MEQIFVYLFGLVIVGLVIVIFLLIRKKEEKPAESMLMLQQQMNNLTNTVDNKLAESIKVILNVTEKLTRLDETNKQVVSFAEQLQQLQDILANPKQRGILGEYYLETVLKNVLPPGSYKMPYYFKDGTAVDAVVFVEKRIIPIDSKFSLENYNRILEAREGSEKKRYETAFINDLKARIEETAKYVRPEENTMNFAFMFIPSEAVYYDLLINKVGAIAEETSNLIYYAGKKKVIVVSPTSFLAYLQTVLQGLRNQKISERAQEIIKEVERLEKHLAIYSEYMKRLGSHLSNTVGAYNKAGKEFSKVDKDVVKIAGGKPKIEIEEVEPPLLEE
jgi:DNA recombination protein RmuC